MPGTGESAAAVLAIRALPQQQQLLLCAAMRLLGAPAPDSPGPSGGFGTPCRPAQVRESSLPGTCRARLPQVHLGPVAQSAAFTRCVPALPGSDVAEHRIYQVTGAAAWLTGWRTGRSVCCGFSSCRQRTIGAGVLAVCSNVCAPLPGNGRLHANMSPRLAQSPHTHADDR